jgi:hypothetical protein
LTGSEDVGYQTILAWGVFDGRQTVLVAGRATGRDMAEMEAVCDRMVRSQENVAELARADLEFHMVMAKATGNSVFGWEVQKNSKIEGREDDSKQELKGKSKTSKHLTPEVKRDEDRICRTGNYGQAHGQEPVEGRL